MGHVFHGPAGLLDRVVVGDLLEDLVQLSTLIMEVLLFDT